MIWAYLLHLSYNMWGDRPVEGHKYFGSQPYLRCDDSLWSYLVQELKNAGFNMVVIDVGDGVQYKSRPEIAVQGAWTVPRLKQELETMRSLGLEPIPKLNFSTCHDQWLGQYSRMVSTPPYYAVCKDLIEEVIEIFDRPRFFHLGMDEEIAYPHQRHFKYLVVRQFDLWWHDLLFYVAEVEKRGVRPWIWSDYVWHHPEEFYSQIPPSVLQSNWYYGMDFNTENPSVRAYVELDQHGLDQVPTGSNWEDEANLAATVEFCRRHVSPDRLKGFLQTVWRPTLEETRERHQQAIRAVADVIRAGRGH